MLRKQQVRFIVSLAMIILCVAKLYAQKIDTYFVHTVLKGETLYSISHTYGVSVDDIIKINPNCKEKLPVGYELRIPVKNEKVNDYIYYTIKQDDTLYRIAHDHNITVDELLKHNSDLKKESYRVGTVIKIPSKKKEFVIDNKENDRKSLFDDGFFGLFKKETNAINAAIILPFASDRKMLEYYEGFLIAVDSLKREGLNLSLNVYDSGQGEKHLREILDKEELKEMDIIFGPFNSDKVNTVSEFSKKHKINVVVPFSSKADAVHNNSMLYQINSPQKELYSTVYNAFLNKYDNVKPIFVEGEPDGKSKKEFTEFIIDNLKKDRIGYSIIRDSITEQNVLYSLDKLKHNVFIPTSSSSQILTKTLHIIMAVTRENPDYAVSLFGYPEWQIYSKDFISRFYELNASFYSPFYTNNVYPEALKFISKYHKWYGKDIQSKYPNYAMLGYDTAFYFLKGLKNNRENLIDGLQNVGITPVQTSLGFERIDGGGFFNNKIFIVEFGRDFELRKVEY